MDNHNKWSSANWEQPGEPSGRPTPLASRPDGRTAPYRPPNYGGISVPEVTRGQRLSEAALSSVPLERRREIESSLREMQEGGFSKSGNRDMSVVASSGQNSLLKQAAAAGLGSQLAIGGGSSNTTHMGPNIYSPLFLTANLQLPRDRPTANAWNRAFYETNPVVRNATNLHATYPISKLRIKCQDKRIERKYLEMAKQVDLFNVCQQIALEYWMIGEAFPYAEYDSARNMWVKIYCHNPDYIAVQRTADPGVTRIAVRPDEKLRSIVISNDPAHAEYRSRLDPVLADAIARNEYIPLDNFNVSHLKNESTAYNTHGSSIIVSVWKDLVLYDLFRENKFIQADAMVNPVTLIKVGASNAEGHYPRQEELNGMRDVWEQAQFDKDFKIFTHPDVAVEKIGSGGSVMDISGDMNFILDNLFIGLMVPRSIITQDGGSYAQASVALDVIKQRYENFRTKISNWLIDKIFAPMAEANEFYETIDGEKHLVLPDIEWNQMTLYDVDAYIGHLKELIGQTGGTDPKGVSFTTLYRSLGLDFKDEMANQRREAIQLAILKKEMEQIQAMSLSELRTLDPEAPIIEKEGELPVGPGVSAAPDDGGGMPGMSGPADMGPMPGGAEPPLPPV
jgi:hypothetical protein